MNDRLIFEVKMNTRLRLGLHAAGLQNRAFALEGRLCRRLGLMTPVVSGTALDQSLVLCGVLTERLHRGDRCLTCATEHEDTADDGVVDG